MSFKTTKYQIKPLGNYEISYKEKLEKIQNIKPSDELPDGWIRLSTYKPDPPKQPVYKHMTPTDEFIMIMDIASKNRFQYYKSRMIEPPYVEISPPEYETVEEDKSESDIDMEDPEYEKIMNKFD